MASPDEQYEEYLAQVEEPNIIKTVPQTALIAVAVIAIMIIFMVQLYELPWKEGAMYFAVLVFLVWVLSQQRGGTIYLTLVQAQKILYHEILDAQIYKNKYSTEIPDGDVTLGKGCDLILNPWDGEPRWRRMGFSIRDKKTRAPLWFHGDVDILINGRGVDRITPLAKPYECEPMVVKLKPVLVSDYKETDRFLRKEG